MANPITWRNINAPDFSASSDMLTAANQSIQGGAKAIGGAFTGVADILKKQEDRLGQAALNEFNLGLLGKSSKELQGMDVQGTLSNILGNSNLPSNIQADVTKSAINSINARINNQLDRESDEATIKGKTLSNTLSELTMQDKVDKSELEVKDLALGVGRKAATQESTIKSVNTENALKIAEDEYSIDMAKVKHKDFTNSEEGYNSAYQFASSIIPAGLVEGTLQLTDTTARDLATQYITQNNIKVDDNTYKAIEDGISDYITLEQGLTASEKAALEAEFSVTHSALLMEDQALTLKAQQNKIAIDSVDITKHTPQYYQGVRNSTIQQLNAKLESFLLTHDKLPTTLFAGTNNAQDGIKNLLNEASTQFNLMKSRKESDLKKVFKDQVDASTKANPKFKNTVEYQQLLAEHEAQLADLASLPLDENVVASTANTIPLERGSLQVYLEDDNGAIAGFSTGLAQGFYISLDNQLKARSAKRSNQSLAITQQAVKDKLDKAKMSFNTNNANRVRAAGIAAVRLAEGSSINQDQTTQFNEFVSGYNN